MNSLLANSILSRKSLVGASDLPTKKLSYLRNLVLGKVWAFVPTLTHLVSRIVGASPKEKVVRVNTSSVVALVKNAHALRNWSVVHNPRDSVGRFGIVSTSVCHSSVAKWRNRAGPLPTIISLIHFRPESFSERLGLRSFCHLSGLPLISGLV